MFEVEKKGDRWQLFGGNGHRGGREEEKEKEKEEEREERNVKEYNDSFKQHGKTRGIEV